MKLSDGVALWWTEMNWTKGYMHLCVWKDTRMNMHSVL